MRQRRDGENQHRTDQHNRRRWRVSKFNGVCEVSKDVSIEKDRGRIVEYHASISGIKLQEKIMFDLGQKVFRIWLEEVANYLPRNAPHVPCEDYLPQSSRVFL